MGALSFKERFVEPVIAGVFSNIEGKTQSVRNFRERPMKVGEWVALYYAQRNPILSEWLAESVIKSRQVVRIDLKDITVYDEIPTGKWTKIKITQCYGLNPVDGFNHVDEFARADGFTDFSDMKNFWLAEHGKKKSPFPYIGHLYKWYRLGELEAYANAGKIKEVVLNTKKDMERVQHFMAFHTTDPKKQLSTFLKETQQP